ncbi:regulating synaptic membrane exocytosis protein 2 isoform X2 [Dendroctonus ponderosae]|uniref:regulating synaptic membrane exocytosis protein 2 isoform X2 n=1 Tax=Dendroctonus ponderosae TaxID=77166 RepID=UPI002034AE7D|nr:regulating synaptic membrane exocytosis protein 2 isoform X2 [Dendroctonus ponderosae]
MEEGPDLSHLTPEERTIIESVMVRQKQEEEREQEIMRKKADEVQSLEQQIRARNEQQKKAGVELEATCHICLKTKFADGIGHICNYCTIRCCARCGGKVTLRSGKSVWVCILCRKKQELLGRTGQWMQGGMQAVISDPESAMLASVIQSDKRPKLERAHSAAEKENQPLQRSGSVLRRQYSEEQSRTPSCDRYKQYNEEDPMFYQGELEGLMRAHPHLLPRIYPDQNPANQPDVRQERLQGQASATKKHKRQTKHHHQTAPPPQLQLHSYSSSEEDLKSTPEYSSDRDSEKGQPNVSWPDSEIYERPHVLVTSPGSPDRHEAPVLGQGPTSVGGRVQIRLGFDTATLQLFVTIVCATGLRPRSEQQARNPYCKLFLLPDRSEKSKRRTRTLGGTTEPMWNQTFVYSGLRRADLRLRSLEITVWDYVRYGANDFLGEANVELWPLDEQPTWRQLVPHEEVALTPSEHLSPPSTGSRFSDSDTTSECEIEGSRERRGADGASVSSVGSSSSPPRECERRSRRDQESIAPYKYKRDSMTGARSHSAAPCDTQVVHSSRSRSKSPRRMATDYRSLSPPDCETVVVSGTRFKSRSATATPTGSPKKRQLPQVPHALARALQERVAQDLEDRGANNRRVRYVHHSYRNSGSSWERRYSGLSDSDLTSHVRSSSHRRNVSPDRDRDPLGLGDFDSDMESVASVTSSSFSTQSERPRGTRMSSAEYSNYSSGGYQMTRNSTASDRGSDRDTMDSLDSHHHSHPDDQNHHHHHHHHHHRREGTVKRGQFTRSLSNTEPPSEDKADGSLSDTAVSQLHGLDVPHRERKDGRDRDRQNQFSGLNKKSSSTSQLSATDTGLARKRTSTTTPPSIQRSQEVVPMIPPRSSEGSQRASSLNSISSSEGSSWSPSLRLTGEGQLAEFIEGLGPGQLVGRQVLGAPSLGDIQLSLCHQRGVLEVEIIRARGLQARTGSKVLPAPYVKVYLVCGKKCYAKAKTQQARRTLDPLYQKQVTFKENYTNCILQVTVWGDYGRIEGKKVFMGVAQIMLDDLNLSNIVIGWYKLFGTTSLVSKR